jgi:hypothetical protein
MWRREERLKYWLENGSQSPESAFCSRLIKKLSLKLRIGQCTGAVHEESLSLDAGVICPDDTLAATACVRSGLDSLGEWAHPKLGSVPGSEACKSMIHPVTLIGRAKAFNVRLQDENLAHARQGELLRAPTCRSFLISIGEIEVYELQHPHSRPPQLKDGNRFLIANPAIQSLTSQMSELPHARASVRIEELGASERKGFLREAEVLKGVPANRAELLAVFRHVPIEVISRLRFLAEKKAILYSISRDTKPTRTRVHDMAAVLDVASKEIHLVPHRTQFRSVSLN